MTDTKPRLTIEGEKDERAKEATANGGAANNGASGKGGNPFSHAREATAAWLSGNFPGHENAVFGGMCGLIVAVLVFEAGMCRRPIRNDPSKRRGQCPTRGIPGSLARRSLRRTPP